MTDFDVTILGAGAAGMMCAAQAGQRGKRVLLLEKSNKVGKKILMSGGGRCNFTNLNTGFENYISHNPHFFKSALSRYTQYDFIDLVKSYEVEYYEKTLGQLFCVEKSQEIVDLLLAECRKGQVSIQTKQQITQVKRKQDIFYIKSNGTTYQSKSLVIATGGLSIPTLGSSPYGYQVAEQFGHHIYPTTAGLVPFTLHDHDKQLFTELSGNSVLVEAQCKGSPIFRENLLFTHRGLSGPAMLQLSSYWRPSENIQISFRPDIDLETILQDTSNRDKKLISVLNHYLPKKLVPVIISHDLLQATIKSLSKSKIESVINQVQQWQCKPNATEGYRTAEVTLGGVNCNEVSSQTFESKLQPNLFFIGEVLDVTGWLGGYNFQWAWSSAVACAKYC